MAVSFQLRKPPRELLGPDSKSLHYRLQPSWRRAQNPPGAESCCYLELFTFLSVIVPPCSRFGLSLSYLLKLRIEQKAWGVSTSKWCLVLARAHVQKGPNAHRSSILQASCTKHAGTGLQITRGRTVYQQRDPFTLGLFLYRASMAVTLKGRPKLLSLSGR